MQSDIRFFLCLIILFSLFAHPTPVFACSCIVPGTPSIEFAQADAVFQGQVLSMVDKQSVITPLFNRVRNWIGLPPRYNFNPNVYGYRVTFAVSRSWKGVSATVAHVTTGYGGGDCGYLFKVGADYVIYAYGHPNDLHASICSRTTELSQAAADLSYLNTLTGLSLTTISPTPGLRISTIVLIVVAVTTIAILWFLRHRRRDKI